MLLAFFFAAAVVITCGSTTRKVATSKGIVSTTSCSWEHAAELSTCKGSNFVCLSTHCFCESTALRGNAFVV